jgi:hypothetical protein
MKTKLNTINSSFLPKMKTQLYFYLICFIAGLLLCNCSGTSNVTRSGDNFSLDKITGDESVVIGTVESQGYVKAVNMYDNNRKLVKSLIYGYGQTKNLNVIVKPGQYYLMVIYSDDCEMIATWGFSTAKDYSGRVTSEKVWGSPPAEFFKFDVPVRSLVDLGAFIVRIDSKTESSPVYGNVTSCSFILNHEKSNVIEEFKTQKPEIYEYFKDRIVIVNED